MTGVTFFALSSAAHAFEASGSTVALVDVSTNRALQSLSADADESSDAAEEVSLPTRDAASNGPDESGTDESGTDDGAVLDLSEVDQPEPGYIYFKEAEPSKITIKARPANTETSAPRSMGFNTGGRFNSLDQASTPTQLWLVSAFTPRNQSAHLEIGRTGDAPQGGLGIAIESNIGLKTQALETSLLPASLGGQTYDLGVNLDYSGFTLGAFVRNRDGVFEPNVRGYDVGVGYRGNRFSTNLMFGEYSQTYEGLAMGFSAEDGRFYTLEFGASYRLWDSLRVTGGYRYLDYSGSGNLDIYGHRQRSLFYLGTAINF